MVFNTVHTEQIFYKTAQSTKWSLHLIVEAILDYKFQGKKTTFVCCPPTNEATALWLAGGSDYAHRFSSEHGKNGPI